MPRDNSEPERLGGDEDIPQFSWMGFDMMEFMVKHISGSDVVLEDTICRDVTCREYMRALRGRLNSAKSSMERAKATIERGDKRAHVVLARIYIYSVSERIQTCGNSEQESWLKSNRAFRHSECHVLKDQKYRDRFYRVKSGDHAGSLHSALGGFVLTSDGARVEDHISSVIPADYEIPAVESIIEFLFDRLERAASNLPDCKHCGDHRLRDFEAASCGTYRECRASKSFRFPLADRTLHHQGENSCPKGNPR